MKFEVLWYQDKDYREDYLTEVFSTLKEAKKFYKQHVDDGNKFGWLITKRDEHWYIMETYVF